MKLRELIRRFEHALPPAWALPDDPIGLHIGDPGEDVRSIYAALEATSEGVAKAAKAGCGLMLVHHPLIYKPLRSLLENRPVERLARELIRNGTALYAMHTNLDLHPQGMAGVWAKKLGCAEAAPAAPKPQAGLCKIVTFVTPDHAAKVRAALSNAGAGRIGEYDQCSYTLRGYGTFRGSDKTNPFIGTPGQFEMEEEERLEMVFPAGRRGAVVKALWESHPYEEPAFDIYPLDDYRSLEHALWIASFPKKLSWAEFEKRVSGSLRGSVSLEAARPDARRKVKTIAISTGSGSSFLPLVSRLDIDAYLTGEMGYHVQWEAREMNINVLLAGHGASESLFPETAKAIIEPFIEEPVKWVLEG